MKSCVQIWCPMFRCGVRLPLPAYIRRCVRLPRPAPIIVMVIVLSGLCQSLLLQAIPTYKGSQFNMHQPIPDYRGRPMHSSAAEARQANMYHMILQRRVAGLASDRVALETCCLNKPTSGELPWSTGKGCCARLQCRVVVIHDPCPLRPPSS